MDEVHGGIFFTLHRFSHKTTTWEFEDGSEYVFEIV